MKMSTSKRDCTRKFYIPNSKSIFCVRLTSPGVIATAIASNLSIKRVNKMIKH